MVAGLTNSIYIPRSGVTGRGGGGGGAAACAAGAGGGAGGSMGANVASMAMAEPARLALNLCLGGSILGQGAPLPMWLAGRVWELALLVSPAFFALPSRVTSVLIYLRPPHRFWRTSLRPSMWLARWRPLASRFTLSPNTTG